MGLGTYFTAGEKEVRAWTFKRGIKAPQAAGIIHSDFEKGFIRAVTMSYDDLVKYGSEKQSRKRDGYTKKEKNISFKMAILWNLDLMCKVM